MSPNTPPTLAAPAYTLIDQPAQLAPFLAALDAADEVFLDTEADNLYHYRTRLCLLQFNIAGQITLVDALAPAIDYSPLWQRLAQKTLVMHGSDFDLRILSDLCGFRARALFDTMLAAQLLHRQHTGLASLIEENYHVALDKHSQTANWSTRPFTPRLLDYAALDVYYLPDLRDKLAAELRALGRLDWLRQQCDHLIDATTTGFPTEDENDWRIGRSERLRPAGQAVLHSLWHWRQDWARKLDVPPFKVTGNALLIQLSESADHGLSARAIMETVKLGKRHDRLAPSLQRALETGLARDPRTLPRRPGRNPNIESLDAAELELQARLRAERDAIAQKLDIEPTLIANRAQLAVIARAPENLREILLPWQADLMERGHAEKTAEAPASPA